MLHKNVGIGDNHPTHNWEYANATARTGATGFVAGDVHKLALQLDDLSLWILVDTTPTWQQFGAGYTNEQAQDAVGGILTDSTTIDFTYDDVGNTITAVTKQQMSITSDASGLKLSGDAASPGNNKVYGTDASGIKGWKNDPAGGGGREVLTTARTYYVRTDGSDSNNGLTNSSGGAFLTIQRAIDVVCSLDMSIYQVTIQVGDGTYTQALLLNQYIGALPPLIQGNTTTPANVIISPTSGTCFSATTGATWRVESMKLQTTGGGHGLYSNSRSVIIHNKLDFGTMIGGAHLYANYNGLIQIALTSGSYTISGSATYHMRAAAGGAIQGFGASVTLSGTPAFSTYAYLSGVSYFYVGSQTFSGSATGVRYSVTLNSAIEGTGGVTTFFPGNSAGSTATGGQYV